MRLKLFGQDHPKLANSFLLLGAANTFRGAGDQELSFAVENYEKGLEVLLKAQSPEVRAQRTAYHNLAGAYLEKKEADKALHYTQKALALGLEEYGAQNLYFAKVNYNSGRAHLLKGQYDKSMHFFEEALSIERKALGDGGAGLGLIYEGLGDNHAQLNEKASARAYYQKALTVIDGESLPSYKTLAKEIKAKLAKLEKPSTSEK